MLHIYGLAALVVLVAAALSVLKRMNPQRGTSSTTEKLPYRRKGYFSSKAEHSFYRVPIPAVDDQWLVFAKVRLFDLVSIPSGTAEYQKHQNRVQSKHVDFALCSPDSVSPRLVIELDDASHKRAKRAVRDQFVDDALRAAGRPILRVPAKRGYDLTRLADEIRRLTEGAPAPAEAERTAATSG